MQIRVLNTKFLLKKLFIVFIKTWKEICYLDQKQRTHIFDNEQQKVIYFTHIFKMYFFVIFNFGNYRFNVWIVSILFFSKILFWHYILPIR